MEKSKQNQDGYNFGITNYRKLALDRIPVNDYLEQKILIERSFMFNKESGYGIYQGENEDGEIVKITGTFPYNLEIGRTYEIKGKVGIFRGEKQLIAEQIKEIRPVTKNGIVSFLQSMEGLYRYAELLYEIYQIEVFDVLENHPEEILNYASDVSRETMQVWSEALRRTDQKQSSLDQLVTYGLTLKEAQSLFERYGQASLSMLEENPYLLMSELSQWTFKKTDQFAQSIGYDMQGSYRIQACILAVIHASKERGHCYLPAEETIKKTSEMLSIRIAKMEAKKLLEKNKEKDIVELTIHGRLYHIAYKELEQSFRVENEEKKKQGVPILRISVERVKQEVQELSTTNQLVVDSDMLYLPELYQAEITVAQRIIRLMQGATHEFCEVEQDMNRYLQQHGYELEERQKEAILTFARGKGGFYILNGNAGSGKTFTLNIILSILDMQFEKEGMIMDVQVFAPTGKASKVAEKATGRKSMTIHRGLGYRPEGGFFYNENNPLGADVLVVDESSMIDIQLASHLMSAIGNETKVILLGDTKQLPSIGAGNVLHDLLNSGVLPVVTLNVVKRQGKDSGIIKNANRIIAGEMITSAKETKDAYVLKKEDSISAQQAILKSIEEIMKTKKFPIEEIQVLCPQKESLIGSNTLNYLIQERFNREKESPKIVNRKVMVYSQQTKKEEWKPLYFRKGDKVMHTQNNYEMKWYTKHGDEYIPDYDRVGITNGETGLIEEIIQGEKSLGFQFRMIVKYDDRYVFYDDRFNELDHAYAMTIHKSQGSQWKAIIIPIFKENQSMLENALIYTGYTRAQKFSLIIGQPEAIQLAIQNTRSLKRYTNLKERLQKLVA